MVARSFEPGAQGGVYAAGPIAHLRRWGKPHPMLLAEQAFGGGEVVVEVAIGLALLDPVVDGGGHLEVEAPGLEQAKLVGAPGGLAPGVGGFSGMEEVWEVVSAGLSHIRWSATSWSPDRGCLLQMGGIIGTEATKGNPKDEARNSKQIRNPNNE